MQNDTRGVNGVATEVSASRGRTQRRSPGDAPGSNRRKKLIMRGLFVRQTPEDFLQSLILSNPVRFLNASLGNYTLEDCT